MKVKGNLLFWSLKELKGQTDAFLAVNNSRKLVIYPYLQDGAYVELDYIWEGIPSSEEPEERLYLQATCNFHYNSIEDSHCPTGLDEMADFCFYCYITGKKLLK